MYINYLNQDLRVSTDMHEEPNKSFSTAKVLAFMYSCAAIMWTVDCSFAKLKGEDFFDLSFEDLLLGLIVVGFAIFAVTIVKLAKQALKSIKPA